MSSPRIRRLKADHERINARFQDWPLIRVESAEGLPPEKYVITYNIRGLYATPGGEIRERHQHTLEINLTLGYPRRQPQCKLLTPIFHPNITNAEVCTGDFYAASEGLDDLVIRIGRMIAYQDYNVKSPLNGLAAKWVEKNNARMPVDRRELAPTAAPTVGAERPPPGPPLQEQTLRAWAERDYERVSELLDQYARVAGPLPPDLAEMHDRPAPALYVRSVRRQIGRVETALRKQEFARALSLAKTPLPPESAREEDRSAVTAAAEAMQEKQSDVAAAWVKYVEFQIDALCQQGESAFEFAPNALAQLERIPISEAWREEVRTACRRKVAESKQLVFAKELRGGDRRQDWPAVLRYGQLILELDRTNAEARSLMAKAQRRQKLDRRITKATNCFAAAEFAECAEICGEIIAEQGSDLTIEIDGVRRTITELRRTAWASEEEFCEYLGVLRAKNTWKNRSLVSWAAHRALTIKPGHGEVLALRSEAERQRAERTDARIALAVILLVICVTALLIGWSLWNGGRPR